MTVIQELDEVHVVSDLHMGGAAADFQVFDQQELLVGLIDHLRDRPKSRRVALVINGDMVDFLAERVHGAPRYFDADGAAAELEAIAGRSAFDPVFDALHKFVRRPGRRLVLVLGNHEIELALPWVREKMVELLARGQAAARGRIHLAFDGAGFLCRVAGRTVLCVHGNDVDPWNFTSYETLRKIAVARTCGRSAEAWTPNAGTKLVLDVINSIKKEAAFIDLMKPEAEVAARIAYAADPSRAANIAACLRVAAKLSIDQVGRRIGLLGGEQESGDTPNEGPYAIPRDDPRELMSRIEQFHGEDLSPLDLIADDSMAELGFWDELKQGNVGAAFFALAGFPRDLRELRELLKDVMTDAAFDPGQGDKTSRALGELVSDDVDVLVAGHTHFEKHLELGGGRLYFNSGTWIPLMRMGAAHLEDQQTFERTFELLKTGTKLQWEQEGLLLRRPAVVQLTAEPGGGFKGELRRVERGDEGVKLQTISPGGGS